MPTLEGQIDDIKEDKEKVSRFRMWLTSESSPKFPVTILQNGIKATIEPPKGLKNNIMRSYLTLDKTEFEDCDKLSAYKSLMWGLCFFNAVVLERRKFGPLGWNIPYQFSNSDLSISQAQLKMFLNFYDKIPWDALRYMVAEANYGGRVTDINDRLTISLILEDFYSPKMLNQGYYIIDGHYRVPDEGDHQSYLDYIVDMPVNDFTEVFGLNDNAEITSAINATNAILETALSVQGSSAAAAGGKSQDEILAEIVEGLLSKLPKNYDLEAVQKKHPIKFEDSMNTVLQQELQRYNNLLGKVRSSLKTVMQAVKGEVPLTS